MALVGGDPADLERARPVLDVLCRRVAHLGPVGSGATMKLTLNMPMAVYWQALAEALTMGSRAGLDMAQMLDLIEDSPAALKALSMKKAAILGQQGEVGFDITGVRKDLVAMTTTGQSLGVPMPAASAALLSFAAATGAQWGNHDLADLIAYYMDMVRHSAGGPA
jgi:3-hydroxyisobutyrate dehydrogenase-like beta-hydroxyacid dehydrogenase